MLTKRKEYVSTSYENVIKWHDVTGTSLRNIGKDMKRPIGRLGKERNRLALQVSPSYYPKIGGMLSKKVKREAFHRWPILERGLHAHFME